MVDPPDALGHHGEGALLTIAQQGAHQRERQGHCAGGFAQGRRGRQGVGVGARVEVLGSDGGEGGRHLAFTTGRFFLGSAGGIHPAEGGEGFGRGGGELDRFGRQDRVHARGPSRALATIMRCTSMVPDATVAAWA